jgi:hypothetical protein
MRILSCSMLLLLTSSAACFSAPPSLERVAPAVGQRGTDFELTITGSGLQRAEEVLLYRNDVRCSRITPVSDNELKLLINANPECPPGECAFRIRSPEGISELLTFLISALPVIQESEENNSDTTAQSIPLDSTVAGVVEAADSDYFRVTLKKGQRLTAEAEAMRAGGAMFDAVLNIYGPDGSWIATADDSPLTRQDPSVSLLAETEGDYLVQIHETSFEGDEDSRYALHIGSFARPSFAWPPGGPAGTTMELVFRDNDQSLFTQSISIPNSSSETIMLFPSTSDQTVAAGVPFRVSRFPNVLEADSSTANSASTIPAVLPAAFNGILQNAGETDTFRFQVTAGQKIRAEVFAGRLGSPVDSLLEIRNSLGEVIAASDDAESPDSAVDVVFSEADLCELRITDKRGNGGAAHFYRVELAEHKPSLSVFVARPDRGSQQRQAIAVPQGNRVLTFLSVQRRGFSGDVHLTPGVLPAGIAMTPTSVPADRFWIPVLMEASADAPIRGAQVPIEAFADSGSGTVTGRFHQVVDLVAASADQLFHQAEVNSLAVAVTESVPWRITLQQPVSQLAPDGTLDLLISVERSAGFSGSIDVSFPFLPPWVDGPDKVTIPASESSAVYTVRAWPDAEARIWSLCAEARPGLLSDEQPENSGGASDSARRNTRPVNRVAVASNLVSLTIARSPVSGKSEALVTEQGRTTDVNYQLALSESLPEILTATLEGLPNRVGAAPVDVRRTDSRVQFRLQAEDTAPIGTFREILVRLTGEIDGRKVSWLAGRGSSLTIEQSGRLFSDESGRPLSRLEVLRREKSAAESKP